MNGNQGLEALAALCGGQSDVPTEAGRRFSESAPSDITSAAGSNNSNMNNLGTSEASNTSQRQSPMVQQSPLHNLTQQQWQQAVAAATALQGNGVSQSSLAQSLMLSGLPGLGDNTYSAMQQYAFQQYIQAQAKLSAAQQAASAHQSMGAQSMGAFGDANQQALVMALAAGKTQQLQQSRGKFDEISDFTLVALKQIVCRWLSP